MSGEISASVDVETKPSSHASPQKEPVAFDPRLSEEGRQVLRHPEDAADLEILHPTRQLDQKLEVETGVFIEYDVVGSDTAPRKLVFIMGFLGTRHDWCGTVNSILEADDQKYQVLLMDNRGVGGSSAPAGRYTTTRMAQDVLTIIDHLKWGAFHIIGISMGGMIALELALLAGKRLRSLSLLVTHAGGKSSLPGRQQLEGFQLVSSTIFTAKTAHDFIGYMLPTLFADDYLEADADDGTNRTNYQKHADIMTARAKLNRAKGVKLRMAGVFGQLAAIATHRVDRLRCETLRSNGAPILIIGAVKDKLVHVRNSRALNKKLAAPSTTYIELDAGHAVNAEREEEVIKALLSNFLKGEEHHSAKANSSSSPPSLSSNL